MLIFCLSNKAFAQMKETVLKSIHDDGRMMQVIITVSLPEITVNYDKKFDVSRMNEDEKHALVENVIDCLGVSRYFKANSSKQIEKELTDDCQNVIGAVLNYVEGVYQKLQKINGASQQVLK